jgi:hypothetical protein
MFYNQLLNQFAWDNSRKGRKCVKRLTWAFNGVFAGKLKHKHIEKHETFRRPSTESSVWCVGYTAILVWRGRPIDIK